MFLFRLKYVVRKSSGVSSTSQIEADIMWESLVAHRPDGEWLKVSPGIRTLSFDIECAGR